MITAHENPFRTSRLLDLPAEWDAAADSPETLLSRWRATGRRGALVGPHGTGKSVRLRALADRLADEGFEIVRVQWHDDGTTTPAEWRRALRSAGPRAVVCLDGSENAGRFSAYFLLRDARRAHGVLATRHAPSLWLPTLARHEPSAELFARHARALAPELDEQEARAAFAAAGANAHEAFRRLYLDYSRLSSRPISAASASAGGLPA